jgi:hypothetical protein
MRRGVLLADTRSWSAPAEQADDLNPEVNKMRTLQEIRSATGLLTEELIVGATETEAHRAMLSGYLSHVWRGSDVVRGLIVADIRSALHLEVQERAADLLLVLRLFLTTHSEAALAPCPCEKNCSELKFDESAARYSSDCPNIVPFARTE